MIGLWVLGLAMLPFLSGIIALLLLLYKRKKKIISKFLTAFIVILFFPIVSVLFTMIFNVFANFFVQT